MRKFKIDKNYLYLLILFVAASCVFLALKENQVNGKIDYNVAEAGNVLLCTLAMIGCAMHMKAVKNSNPNVFVRSIMLVMMIKFFVLIGALAVYLYTAGRMKNTPAIFICMGLYVVYTILEVRGAYLLNVKKNVNK
jgi:cytochrome bd-type quinol oxidase subunit 2